MEVMEVMAVMTVMEVMEVMVVMVEASYIIHMLDSIHGFIKSAPL
jgi:hypothetical protein